MKTFQALQLCCFAIFVTHGIANATTLYKAIGLTTSDTYASQAQAISNTQQTVGAAYPVGKQQTAAIWKGSASGNLLANPTDGKQYVQTIAYGINDFGVTVGYSICSTDGRSYLTVWDSNGKPDNIGTLDAFSALGYAINNQGQVTGYTMSYVNGWPSYRVFRWDAVTGFESLGYGCGYAINNWGVVAGSYSTNPCYWDANGNRHLINGCGEACGINDAGEVVGMSYNKAFRWSASEGIVYLDLLPGYTRSRALAVNSLGQIVGTCSGENDNDTVACIWDPLAGVQALPCLSGDSYARAFDINDSGQIVGYSCGSSRHATLWQPVPEPSSILAIFCGMGSLACWRKRN